MRRVEGVFEKSTPPALDRLDQATRVAAMVNWFLENFEDPANSLPYDTREGGYQWLWGGPFDAIEELAEAFPEAAEEDVEAAAEMLRAQHPVEHWSVANRRIDPEAPSRGEFRHARDPENPHSGAVVETVLYPMQDFGWVMRATFIPGTSNLALGDEFDGINIPGLELRRLVNSNLVELTALLLGETAENGEEPEHLQASLDWLAAVERDSEVFTSDEIIVHASPPEWASLQSILSHAGNAAPSALLLLQDPGNYVMAALSYGGARVFLRVVAGAEGSVDALFERVNKKIRGGAK